MIETEPEDLPGRSYAGIRTTKAPRVVRRSHLLVGSHLQCSIQDDVSEDLTPVMKEALPWISDALSDPDNRVLVHGAGGQSRCASVVIAYIMQAQGVSYQDAFKFVRGRRRGARPNPGFVKQLKACAWAADDNEPEI